MPSFIAGLLIPVIFATGASYAVTMAVSLAIGYAATAAALYYAQRALAPRVAMPELPKPEDGKYNLKQDVPSLPYVLGRVAKGGDYVFLEETGGTAYHITVVAGHSINGFVKHRLHDEDITIDGSGVITAPTNFAPGGVGKVRIITRTGEAAQAAFSQVTAAFPTIWTSVHRGDGLAAVLMTCDSVAAADYQKVYPQQMPAQSHVIEGHDGIFDPRDESTGYTENLALLRLWHLTHPVGGKLTLADMYLPDWATAADVCDEAVLNREEYEEPRYHGGMWFRASNDPVEVGRTLDQAAELVCFERPDGLVGVHAGAWSEPDVRLTENDVFAVSFDANRRLSSTVLAVRGRFTDIERDFVTADAAPYGDPYVDDTQRTRTIDNPTVQRHNHVSRLMKLAFIRANAPRVTIVATYEAAKNVPYRRFVRVHIPPRLDEAVIEITSRPKLRLRELRVEFSGIVVPEDLYDFDALTEEGEPPARPEDVDGTGVPVPVGFDVTIYSEAVAGGALAAYASAEWTEVSDALTYELEWQPIGGGAKQSVMSVAGELELRTGYLADAVEYQFRLRAWSSGTSSEWTSYVTRTATADPAAPGVVTGVSATGGAGEIDLEWTAPNSANYHAAKIYTSTANDFSSAALSATEYGSPNAADSRTIAGLAAGTWYAWIVATNASGIAASPVATGTITVT